jgi:hypothetical protein
MLFLRVRKTYGKPWGRGPGGFTLDIADEGLVKVAGAEEAIEEALDMGTHRRVCHMYLVSIYSILGISDQFPES